MSAFTPTEQGEPSEGLRVDDRWLKDWDPNRARLFAVENTGGTVLLQGKVPQRSDLTELTRRLQGAPGVTEADVVHTMNDTVQAAQPNAAPTTAVLFELSLAVPERTDEFRARLLDARAQATGLEGGLDPVTVQPRQPPTQPAATAPDLGWELIGIIQTRAGRTSQPKAWLRDRGGLAHQLVPGDELQPGWVLISIDPQARTAVVMRTQEGHKPLRYILRVSNGVP